MYLLEINAFLLFCVSFLSGVVNVDAECLEAQAVDCIHNASFTFPNHGKVCRYLNRQSLGTAVESLHGCISDVVDECDSKMIAMLWLHANRLIQQWQQSLHICHQMNCVKLAKCGTHLVRTPQKAICEIDSVLGDVYNCTKSVRGYCPARNMYNRALSFYKQACTRDCGNLYHKLGIVQGCAVDFRNALKALVKGRSPANVTKPPCELIRESVMCFKNATERCYLLTAIAIYNVGPLISTISKQCDADTRFLCRLTDPKCTSSAPEGRLCRTNKPHSRYWYDKCTRTCRKFRHKGCALRFSYTSLKTCEQVARTRNQRDLQECLPPEIPMQQFPAISPMML